MFQEKNRSIEFVKMNSKLVSAFFHIISPLEIQMVCTVGNGIPSKATEHCCYGDTNEWFSTDISYITVGFLSLLHN